MEKKINILVTGANGQLGSELQYLSKNYPQFSFTFTDVDTVNISNAGEIELYVKKQPPHVIINCAAYTAVDKAESDRETAFLINATAVDYLVDAARQSNASLIHISTDYVFDGTQNTPYSEDDIAIPETAYGQTKYEGENLILYSDINGLVVRTSWLYSTFGNNFVKTMLRLSKEREEINVVFDQVGTPTYARDLARAILEMVPQVHARKDKTQEIYHYTNEGVASWYDLAVEIFRFKKIPCKVNAVDTSQFPTPAKRPAFSVLNKTKIKQQFALNIPHWVDSLHQMLNDLENI